MTEGEGGSKKSEICVTSFTNVPLGQLFKNRPVGVKSYIRMFIVLTWHIRGYVFILDLWQYLSNVVLFWFPKWCIN